MKDTAKSRERECAAELRDRLHKLRGCRSFAERPYPVLMQFVASPEATPFRAPSPMVKPMNQLTRAVEGEILSSMRFDLNIIVEISHEVAR